MITRYRIPLALGLVLSLVASARVESNPGSLQDGDADGTTAAFLVGSGLGLGPPGAVTDPDLLAGAVLARLSTLRPIFSLSARPRGRPAEPPSIGEWSELLAGPPSERLHQSATYDPKRRRVLVFGGLAHVWVHGDLSYLELDGEGSWHHVDPALSPPARWGHAAVHDPVRDRVIVFGGMGTSRPLGDVWALSLDTLEWRELSPSGSGPSPRFAHVAICDPVGDRMIVFGGYDGTFRNDLWELTLTGDGAWTELAPAGNVPPTLDAAAAVYDPRRQRMVVFGGFDGGTSRDDVWALALAGAPSWSPIRALGDRPAIRRQHAAIYDPVRDRLVVFGGTAVTEGPGYDDVWALPLGDTPTWRSLSPSGPSPTRRWGHSLLYDPVADRAVLFGGVDLLDWRHDTWELGLSNPAWKALEESHAVPAARWGHSSTLDPSRDRLLVFMGAGQARWFADLWALDLSRPTAWREISTAGTTPCARQDAAAILDPVRDRVLLFGGRTWWPSNELWALSLVGTPTWTYFEPQGDSPAPRAAHSAVYDPQRDRMLVFGGYDGFEERNDLWALSMSGRPQWSQLEVRGPAPDIRQAHAAVYDAVRGRMLVFGGIAMTRGSAYGDVWALSLAGAAAWTRVSSGDSPGPRWGHEAIWDDAHDRMLVFGGEAPDGSRSDTWSLAFSPGDGERGEWQRLDPGGSRPSRRTGHSAVLDAGRNRMLVFGGRSDVAFFDDASALDLGPVAATAGARQGKDGAATLAPSGSAPVETPAALEPPAAPSIARVALDPEGRTLVARVRLPAQGATRFVITDVRGRRIAERALEGAAGDRQLEFDLGALPRGIYWLRVTQNGKSASAQFARLHR